MKTNSVLVIVGFLLAFTAGYFLFGQSDAPKEDASSSDTSQTEEKGEESSEDNSAEELASMIPEEAEVLSRNSCLGCHSVESLDAKGGDSGPDLSRVFPEMKDKHGKDLDEFLQEPTAAVMATIIAENPLEEDERKEIVKTLELAAEKRNESSEDSSNKGEDNDDKE